VKHAADPVWDAEHNFTDYSEGDELVFEVWIEASTPKESLLGKTTLKSQQFEAGFCGGVLLGHMSNGAQPILRLNIAAFRPATPSRSLSGLSSLSNFHRKGWHLSKSGYMPLITGDGDSRSSCHFLRVKIFRATGLRNADWLPGRGKALGLSDPYCTCEIPGKPKTGFRTATVRDNLNPVWNHEGFITGYTPGDPLFFEVWDEDDGKKDDFLGAVELAAVHFDPVAFEGDVHLSEAGSNIRAQLRVRVETSDFQRTLGVATTTGLGIRRKLWASWTRCAHITVTQDMKDRPSITGLHMRKNVRNLPTAISHGIAAEKRKAKVALLDMVWARREQVMRATRDTVKEAMTADPDMCVCLRRWIHSIVESIWYDINLEVEIMVESARVGVAGHSMHDVQSLGEVGYQPPCCCHPLAIRGFLLYHFLPYNRSFLGQLKDPIYLVMLALSFTPIVRCFLYLLVLVLFLCPGPPDEYQMVQFIMAFKAIQFLSSGVGLALMGTWRYYWCVESGGVHSCDDNGPGESPTFGHYYGHLGAVDIVGSCVLVWMAFLLLPFSVQNAGLRKPDEDEHEERVLTDNPLVCCRGSWYRFQYEGRGGRIGGLCRYDFCCFLLSGVLLVSLECMRYHEDPKKFLEKKAGRMGTWQFRETLFIARVFYGLTALPFAVFNLPILSQILTHTVPTGFNKRGACVAYLLPPVEWEESEDEEGNNEEITTV